MLQPGQPAPVFELPDADMQTVDLSAFKGKKHVVLYFYPKDGTPGCTLVTTDFSDHEEQFVKHDCVVLGVSRDDCLTHADFRDRHGVTIAPALRHRGRGVPQVRRAAGEGGRRRRRRECLVRSTFIIDKKGVIRHVAYGVNPRGHAAEVFDLVKTPTARQVAGIPSSGVQHRAARRARRELSHAPEELFTTCTAATARCSPALEKALEGKGAGRIGARAARARARRSATTTPSSCASSRRSATARASRVGMQVEEDDAHLHRDRRRRRQAWCSTRNHPLAGMALRFSRCNSYRARRPGEEEIAARSIIALSRNNRGGGNAEGHPVVRDRNAGRVRWSRRRARVSSSSATSRRRSTACCATTRSSGACATSSSSSANTSASTSSRATATRCRSTAPRAAGSTALAKNEGGIIGFGSTYDLHQPGALIFVNHPFPVLEEERLPTPPLMLGEGYCREPFEARSIVNISGMSFGAISAPAVRALSRGAARRRLLDGHRRRRPLALSPRGRLRRHHADRHRQVRRARRAGQLLDRARCSSSPRVVKAFEIKLSQGAKPGKGGVLPGRQGDARDRAASAAFPRGATRSAPTAIATSPT